jgi:hypothetical protein
MNKPVTPKQLELVEGMTREEMILATAPHIDPDSPALKADAGKIQKIEIAEAATAVLAASGPGPSNDQSYDDFDWCRDPSIVLREQRATAIYRNNSNSIVIRQERTWDEESDPFMVITEENLVTFMEALATRARE